MAESSLAPARDEKARRGLSGPSLAAESVGRTKAVLLSIAGLSVVVKGNPPTHIYNPQNKLERAWGFCVSLDVSEKVC